MDGNAWPVQRARSEELIALVKANLALWMEEREMRSAPLSRAAGLNESAARDILRDKSRNPGVVTLARLADALGIELVDLIEPIEAASARPTCPHCGSAEATHALSPCGERGWRVCLECGAHGPEVQTRRRATAQWAPDADKAWRSRANDATAAP